MTNIWKKSSLSINPYHETAFKALGLTRENISRAEMDQRVEERRQAVRNVPGYHLLGERPLIQADITSARQILFDSTRRMLEELLEHKPERLKVDEIERAHARLKMPDSPNDAEPVCRFAFLSRVVQDLALSHLKGLPPVEIPAFPVDLHGIPPFGLPGEEDDEQG
jgi:hypothetical protein